MILNSAKHKELGEFALVLLDEGHGLAVCLLASWGQACFGLLGAEWKMDEASCPKTLVGAVPEHSLLHGTQKAAFGVALLSQGEASLCPACVPQGPCENSGRWWHRLGKALGRRPVLFAELPQGRQVALARVSPLPGEPGPETVLGPHHTARPASLQHPWQGWGSARGYYPWDGYCP